MEKLQSALAKARAQRDGAPLGPVTRTDPNSRTKSRQVAENEALTALWREVPLFEPSTRRLKQARIFTSTPTTEATHFDILRTKLLLEMRRNDWSRIAITSATSASGKTTTGCNLIAGFGRQSEVRGMLFDFDLRRPAVARFFGAEPTSSIVDVLEEKVPYAEQAMRLHDNTLVSMTTKALRDPSKVLLTQRSAEILDDIQSTYRPDIMLFDLPPVLVSDETRAFLKLVDAVLIVAAADSSTISQIDECEREVSEYSNVAGVVLNKCQFMDDGYGYSY